MEKIGHNFLSYLILFNRSLKFKLLFFLFAKLCCGQDLQLGKVVKVKDGDTFVILQNQKSITIRLAEIDCPEKKQAFGLQAKAFTTSMIAGSVVKYRILKKEKYNRFLAYVYLPDGSVLNEILVRKGLAWQYKKYSKSNHYQLLENKARNEKLGLWKEDHPKAPWEWRKLK